MWFAILSEDVANSLELRQKVRSEHLQRLVILQQENRLLLAGPHPINDNEALQTGFSGSLVIAEFASLKEAQRWANDDPYCHAGVYQKVQVKPFKKVLP